MHDIPFQTIHWATVEKIEHKGEAGVAIWQTIQLGHLRIRVVEYSKGYIADHWCQKGHIVYCVSGSFISELSTGEKITLVKGDTYVVSEDMSSHRSVSIDGATLFIVDGAFLK